MFKSLTYVKHLDRYDLIDDEFPSEVLWAQYTYTYKLPNSIFCMLHMYSDTRLPLYTGKTGLIANVKKYLDTYPQEFKDVNGFAASRVVLLQATIQVEQTFPEYDIRKYQRCLINHLRKLHWVGKYN